MTDSIRKSNIRVERYLRAAVLNDVVELEKRVWKKEGMYITASIRIFNGRNCACKRS